MSPTLAWQLSELICSNSQLHTRGHQRQGLSVRERDCLKPRIKIHSVIQIWTFFVYSKHVGFEQLCDRIYFVLKRIFSAHLWLLTCIVTDNGHHYISGAGACLSALTLWRTVSPENHTRQLLPMLSRSVYCSTTVFSFTHCSSPFLLQPFFFPFLSFSPRSFCISPLCCNIDANILFWSWNVIKFWCF